jgi:hypothetical protein
MKGLSPNFHRICAIARQLRYQTLERVVGQRVLVGSEASVVTDVLDALDRFLPARLEPLHTPSAGLPTVAKYALLDLELSLPPGTARDLPRLSLQALRDLEVVVPASPGEDGVCLDMLSEEVSSGSLVLKLMLDAVHDDRSVGQRLHHVVKGLPRGYLPRMFCVRDACITNAPMLWLGKHFYL